MKAGLLEQIGDWNPQLYREIKGQAKLPILLLTLVTSLFFQLLLLVYNVSYSLEEGGVVTVDWKQLFFLLNCLLPAAAIASSVYLLSYDLCREKVRGTLNFLLLTPQPSAKIVFGKLLGVPLFIYLGAALALPLQFSIAFFNKVPLLPLLTLYLFWLGVGCISCKAALLLSLGANGRNYKLLPFAIAASNIIATAALILYFLPERWPEIYQALLYSSFSFLTDDALIFANIKTLSLLFVLNFWTSQILNRRFEAPKRTLISKEQSYWIVGLMMLWVLATPLSQLPGFSLSDVTSAIESPPLLLYLIVLLAIAIAPSRQSLLERARNFQLKSLRKGERLRELLFGETSPAPAAIALNFAFIGVVWLPLKAFQIGQQLFEYPVDDWFVPFSEDELFCSPLMESFNFFDYASSTFLSAFSRVILILIYATLYQSIRFQEKKNKRELIISSAWVGLLASPFVPLIFDSIFQLSFESKSILVGLTPGILHPDFAALTKCYKFSMMFLSAIVIQLVVLGLLLLRLQQQLQGARISQRS